MTHQNTKTHLDLTKIRSDFPILSRTINNKPLIYLDNAATSQKPQQVIDTLVDYYSNFNANIHRGVHALSQIATERYEEARKKVQKHLNAGLAHEIIFTSGVTHAMNLIANGFAHLLSSSDEIVVSAVEHHSNIVPWQMMCERTGSQLRVLPMNEQGELVMSEIDSIINSNTKLVVVNHISNALGTINPVEDIIQRAHEIGAAVVIDGAQTGCHKRIDVQELDADFYVISGHKMCGPTGIGALYGKEEWLLKLPPYQGGGEMIAEVSFEKTTYAGLPHKFEAGTPHISGAIGMGAAIDYLNEIGLDAITAYENDLLAYADEQLQQIEGLKIYGLETPRTGVLSFNIEGIHPYDLGTLLDKMGIAVRTGHHCAQPIMDFYKIPGTVRASFAFYNTREEVDALKKGIERAKAMLS